MDFPCAIVDCFAQHPNLCRLSIAKKTVKGKPIDQVAVKFVMAEKKLLEFVPVDELVPDIFLEAPTDVVQGKPAYTFEIKANQAVAFRPQGKGINLPLGHRQDTDPLIGGIQITADMGQKAGTLGGFIQDSHGQWVMLTSHAVVQSTVEGVYQAGPKGRKIGAYRNYPAELGFPVAVHMEPDLRFQPRAIMGIDVPVLLDEYTVPTLGMKVVKSGRTTGVTTGVVSEVNTFAFLSQVNGDEHYSEFMAELFVVESDTKATFATNGDAGALIIHDGGIIGMVIGGTEKETLCCTSEAISDCIDQTD